MSEHVRIAFEHHAPPCLPRGELWIGTMVFEQRQMEDNVGAHLELCQEMGMDLISLPVGDSQISPSGYRIFSPADIEKAAQSDLFVVAVISGPFQRVVNKSSLSLVLADVGRDTSEIKEALRDEAQEAGSLIDVCTEHGADAVVIADDLAYNRATFFSPNVFRELILPFYLELVDNVHRHNAYAILHSDGNIAKIVPDIVSSGFNGLSCQEECVDLFSLRGTYGTSLTLLAGLNCELLDAGLLTARRKKRFIEKIASLSERGGLILSSSSGLYSARMLLNAQRLYQVVDEALA
jgi:uroporphyrinogen decarboxylase